MDRFVQSAFADEPVFGSEVDLDAVLGPVRLYPIFDYSMKDVKRAGEVISGPLPWTDETEPQINMRTVERPSTKSSKGIAVLSPDPNSPLPAAAALIHALKAANVPFDLMPGSDLNFSLQGIPAPIPAMLITSKVTS